MRANLEEGLTKMNQYGNLKDIVGIQVCKVKRVKIEKSTKERRNK
jgi:hypothetical protein